jgi:hypothetical protein
MLEKLNKIKDESLRDGKGVIVHIDNFNWLIEQAEKADRYEDLALDHHYQTILDEME